MSESNHGAGSVSLRAPSDTMRQLPQAAFAPPIICLIDHQDTPATPPDAIWPMIEPISRPPARRQRVRLRRPPAPREIDRKSCGKRFVRRDPKLPFATSAADGRDGGRLPTFNNPVANGEVAPVPDLRAGCSRIRSSTHTSHGATPYASAVSSAFASFRSAKSNPSVNQS
jgi:hypothetical protein